MLAVQGPAQPIAGAQRRVRPAAHETILTHWRNRPETLGWYHLPKMIRGSVMMEIAIIGLLFLSAVVFGAHAYDAIHTH